MKHQHPSSSPPSTTIFEMGCCISKCSPDQQHLSNHVQEKLVISQPPTPIPHFNKISALAPPSPTSSTCSFTSNTILTSASSLSTASSSSALTSKDSSFSNDFLWSCYKHNPHIIRINSLKEASLSLVPTTKPPASSVPQKRLRSTSPANLTRHKSMRKEADTPNSPHINLPSRTLRSPSPSRRFDGGNYNINGLSNPMMIRKENMKASSPNTSSRGLRHRENCSNSRRSRVGNSNSNSKIEERAVKEVECKLDMRLGMMEDIHNPLISLDCFIFL